VTLTVSIKAIQQVDASNADFEDAPLFAALSELILRFSDTICTAIPLLDMPAGLT
jgi:hypothetical protein